MSLTPIQRFVVRCILLMLSITLIFVAVFVLQMFGFIETRHGAILVTIILLLYILPPFIFGPIKLYRNHRMSATSEYETIHPARQVVPEEVWDHIRETVANLNPCGFRVLSHFRKSGITGATSFVSLLENANHVTLGKLFTVFVATRRGLPGHHSLAFFSESADGMEIVTTNTDTLGHTPHRKKKLGLHMPEVQNPRELYEFHKRLVESFLKLPKPFNLDGDPAGYMKQYGEAQVAHWVKRGYYRLDATADVYRLTLKGAILTAWKYHQFVKPLRRAWRRYQTNKLLRKLEE